MKDYIFAESNINIVIYHLRNQSPEEVLQSEEVDEIESDHNTVHSINKNQIQEIRISDKALNVFENQVIFDTSRNKGKKNFSEYTRNFVQIATNEATHGVFQNINSSKNLACLTLQTR